MALRRGKPVRAIITIVFLLVVAAGAGFVWLNYDRLTGASQSLVEAGQDTSAPADMTENAVSEKDFDAFQQQTTASLQSTSEALTAQQAELRRLSDLISTLTSKIETLQSQPGLAPAPVVARQITTPARSATTTVPPRNRPAVSKPAGAISVGGAPLPTQPSR
jgi:uncharacterized coiled-coil protein SlyX